MDMDDTDTTDIVRELGYLTLGSRLKRLGERLQAQAQVLLDDGSMSLPASHCPMLEALARLGPLGVGELAQAIGVSQPAVTRMLQKLEAEGLVKSQATSADRRVRPIALTRTGRQLVERSRQLLWPRIEASVADACAGAAGPLLAQLATVEAALATAPLHVRATRLSARQTRLAPRERKHAGA
jgi:DNA-binding MarR family transcriptional regulator